MKPDRWTMHHPRKCGLDELPGGRCSCPPGWPRRAAWWRGEMAIGAKNVEALLTRWRESQASGAVDPVGGVATK